MELKFRDLRADEIECRIGTVKDNGVSLLLYKDARCDQNILDETVGAMNWQRRHTRDNANCIVSIWDTDKSIWVEKEDTGTESRTEAEKGLASDSFKRACFNWGIGRELYTAPFIWISGATRDDKFYVSSITVENKRITSLVICSKDRYGNLTSTVAYQYPRQRAGAEQRRSSEEKRSVDTSIITSADAKVLKMRLEETQSDVKAFLKHVAKKSGFPADTVDSLTRSQYEIASQALDEKEKHMRSEV